MNDDATHRDIAVEDSTLLALFHRAARLMARMHHQHGHAHHAQRHVLRILKERGEMNQRELLDILDVRSASLSELLAKLERHDCISRKRDEEDKRNYIISITEKGEEIAEHSEKTENSNAGAMFAPLSEDERRTLGQLLAKLIVALEDALPEHGPDHPHHEHRHRHMHGMRHEHREGHEHGCHGRRREGPGRRGRGEGPGSRDHDRPRHEGPMDE